MAELPGLGFKSRPGRLASGGRLRPEKNILEHELVPKHIILSPEEREEVIKKYRITKLSQLPRILTTDPIVKIIGAKKGDIIKIIRKSSTAKESVYYRIVVEG